MSKHPYPEHVVEAVQKQMDWAGSTAQVALQALWDASRVETLSEVESLLPNTLLYTAKTQPRTFMMAGGVAMKQDPDLLPAHIIHWGDSDE